MRYALHQGLEYRIIRRVDSRARNKHFIFNFSNIAHRAARVSSRFIGEIDNGRSLKLPPPARESGSNAEWVYLLLKIGRI